MHEDRNDFVYLGYRSIVMTRYRKSTTAVLKILHQFGDLAFPIRHLFFSALSASSAVKCSFLDERYKLKSTR